MAKPPSEGNLSRLQKSGAGPLPTSPLAVHRSNVRQSVTTSKDMIHLASCGHCHKNHVVQYSPMYQAYHPQYHQTTTGPLCVYCSHVHVQNPGPQSIEPQDRKSRLEAMKQKRRQKQYLMSVAHYGPPSLPTYGPHINQLPVPSPLNHNYHQFYSQIVPTVPELGEVDIPPGGYVRSGRSQSMVVPGNFSPSRSLQPKSRSLGSKSLRPPLLNRQLSMDYSSPTSTIVEELDLTSPTTNPSCGDTTEDSTETEEATGAEDTEDATDIRRDDGVLDKTELDKQSSDYDSGTAGSVVGIGTEPLEFQQGDDKCLSVSNHIVNHNNLNNVGSGGSGSGSCSEDGSNSSGPMLTEPISASNAMRGGVKVTCL